MTIRRNMTFYCLTLCAITLLLILLNACRPVGAGGYSATATHGAEQWHIQLTAQAVQATRAGLP